MNLSQMLEVCSAANHGVPEAGSAQEAEALACFRSFFENLTEAAVREHCRRVYAPTAILHDTLKTLQGIEPIESYFIKTAQRAKGVQVQVTDVVRSGEVHYLRWHMSITWSAFKKGTTESDGLSLLRFNRAGHVQLHHDFWDSTNGFFIHLPALGWMIRQVIRRV